MFFLLFCADYIKGVVNEGMAIAGTVCNEKGDIINKANYSKYNAWVEKNFDVDDIVSKIVVALKKDPTLKKSDDELKKIYKDYLLHRFTAQDYLKYLCRYKFNQIAADKGNFIETPFSEISGKKTVKLTWYLNENNKITELKVDGISLLGGYRKQAADAARKKETESHLEKVIASTNKLKEKIQ